MNDSAACRLSIVEADGTLIAVMSQGDFVSYTWPELIERFTELAGATVPERINPAFILVSILLYTAALVFIITSVL